MIVVFPAPVGPTRAMVCPAATSRLKSTMIGVPGLYANWTSLKLTSPRTGPKGGLSAASSNSGRVSMISKTRSAPASAACIEL